MEVAYLHVRLDITALHISEFVQINCKVLFGERDVMPMEADDVMISPMTS